MESRSATAFLTFLEHEDEETLMEKATHVRVLTQSVGWDVVCDLVDREINNVRSQMEWGGVRDQAEYTRAIGRICGLQQLRGAAEAVLIQAQRNEETARQAVEETLTHG